MSGPDDQPRPASSWPWIATALGALFLLVAGVVFWTVVTVPNRLIEAGGDAVRELQGLAQAFSQGTVTHEFITYTTELSGSTYLQVASLDQVEVFVLEDAASTLWGAVELPTVEVRATAPVTFTYFLDLDGVWDLELQDGRVLVAAPRLRWNKPAVDVSRLEYEVRQGSLLRDEEEVLATLAREITGRTAIRAGENISLVRETARRQAEGFVRTWLLHNFPDDKDYPVELYFADESGPVDLTNGVRSLGREVP